MQGEGWYFVDVDGRRHGPVSADALVAAHARGELTDAGPVWHEGLADWIPFRAAAGAPVPPGASAPPPPPPDGTLAGDVVYAGFLRRWAALVVDNIIVQVGLLAICVVLVLAFGAGGRGEDGAASGLLAAVLWLVWLAGAAIYYAGQESSAHQATLGKRLLGIKVTDARGQRLDFARALGRWFAALLSYLTLYVGFLMAAFTDRKRALHDMVADTLVVDRWAYTAHPERQQRGTGGCLVAFVLMMVLAVPVIAILAAISISQYQDYVIRSQVSEATVIDEGGRQAVAEFYNRQGRFPADNAEAGLPPDGGIAGIYTRDLQIRDGRVLVSFSNQAPHRANAALDGRRLYFDPRPAEGQLTWECGSDDIPQKFCPRACRCVER